MTTLPTNSHTNNLPQEDHLQENVLPQEDLHPRTHFQLHSIRRATNRPFTKAQQDLYSSDMTINPFQLL